MRLRRTAILALLPAAAASPATAADPLLAPVSACVDQTSVNVSAARQEAAMGCLVRWARSRAGVRAGDTTASLHRSGQMKADMIARCGRLTHSACGKSWNGVFRTVGFRGLAFENLAAGSGRYASVRSAMASWLGSPGHRAALLDRRVTVFGIGSRQRVRVDGWRGSVWVLHLGRP
jgi:uncharacterized protein YkwD